MLYYRQFGAERSCEKYSVNKKSASGAELWECALNYKIMRHLKENSEEEAWARLFSCNLFAINGGAGDSVVSDAGENARRPEYKIV
ncbi:MAG: hypothetical protein SPH68_05380 [Candidatus Borkfalkiaceae bacterium]|nr:hypothetical protein [Clostridia bacterium]MDY6223572.1 hypothetical protein [Christensenellaceae bacterium]